MHPLAVAAPGRIWQGLKAFAWFVRGMLGENAYEQYLQYHRASQCGREPMSEREFWRDRMDRQERNPQGRCC